jgi:hypothetical protein
MTRFTWKVIGGLFPFLIAIMAVDLRHPYRTITTIGLCIIWANAVGFIERGNRKVGL